MDPRPAVIDRRLEDVKRIITVSGGKGGVGKSSTASLLALSLSHEGKRVGLLDLDFTGPSCHVIIGAAGAMPKEEKGRLLPQIMGTSFMSIIFFSGDHPSPLRGPDISNAIIELLAITQWGSLDYLIIDMPPGIGDTTFDVIRLIGRAEFLEVTTRSKVAAEVTRKEISLLKEIGVPVLGVIENMKLSGVSEGNGGLSDLGATLLGTVDFDTGFEEATGNEERLAATEFFSRLHAIALGIFV